MQQSDSYSRQLSIGFPSLRFERPLEAEFRARYATRGPGFLGISLALGLMVLAVSCVLDWQLRAAGLALQNTAVRLLVMAPSAALALLAIHTGLLRHRWPQLLAATAAGFSAGSVLLSVLAVAHRAPPGVLDGAALTLFVYLLLGLRFYTAVAFAMPIAAALAAAVAVGIGGAEGGSQLAFLLAVNVTAAIASYQMEHSARTSYLEREIVNLLAGSDTSTGIANRRLFAAHLQSVRRQANRDQRGLALVLIEIEQLAEFESHYGKTETETMLRRVAHTVMRGARRPLDCAARLGGAQFIVALYDPDREYVDALAAELREGVALLAIAHRAAPSGILSVSIGAALSPPHSYHDSEELLRLADQALQAAKSGTRGGVVVRSVLQPHGPTVTVGPWSAREPG
jgi:diguanylate cyclase (GGDEF)-like protein